jgi:hypothetical protein
MTHSPIPKKPKRMNATRLATDLPPDTRTEKEVVRGVKTADEEARGYGGYVRVSPEWIDLKRGVNGVVAPRNCFYANLELFRSRNNPLDRLLVATLCREGINLHHCFIMNGDFIIDHSNLMRKKLDRDLYFKANEVVDFQFLNVYPSLDGDIIGNIAQTLKEKGRSEIPKQHGTMDEAMRMIISLP